MSNYSKAQSILNRAAIIAVLKAKAEAAKKLQK